MNIKDLKSGPIVRVKLFYDGGVSVIRFRFEGESLIKETLSNSGEWIFVPENEASTRIENVTREVPTDLDDWIDPADWKPLHPTE